jgi:hypothetical protein
MLAYAGIRYVGSHGALHHRSSPFRGGPAQRDLLLILFFYFYFLFFSFFAIWAVMALFHTILTFSGPAQRDLLLISDVRDPTGVRICTFVLVKQVN